MSFSSLSPPLSLPSCSLSLLQSWRTSCGRPLLPPTQLLLLNPVQLWVKAQLEVGELWRSLMGRKEGQKLLSGSKFPSTPRSACAHLSDGFFFSLSSLPVSSPSCFSSSCLFVSVSDLISLSCFCFCFLFGLLICPFTLYLCFSSLSLCFYVSLLLSLLLYLYFGVSLSLSSPYSLPISLPYLYLSPQSKKPSLMVPKVSGLHSCSVLCCLSVCLGLGEIGE